MSKINHNRNSNKFRGKRKENLGFLDISTETSINFKKQFRKRLKERIKEKKQEQLRIKSIFKKAKPRLLRNGKIVKNND